VEAKHKAQNSGYVKSVGELGRLHDACGKTVSTYREEWDFLWGKMSSSQIKMVVDPEDARLYVMGKSSCREAHGWIYGRKEYGSFKKMVIENETEALRQGSLQSWYGLYGRDSATKEEKISYSPGDMVKVWKVAVKAKV
ncbi:hypothetical protein BGZ70_005323, partial [Mortierella alpina]